MLSDHVRWLSRAGKAFLCVSLLPLACGAAPGTELAPIRLLMDPPPASLNPRSTVDASGQKLNALLYSGLTRLDQNLSPQPDLAESWSFARSGREARFTLRKGLRDHSGQPITPSAISACLEQYRIGKPTSLYASSFPNWIGTRHTESQVILELGKPDANLLRNLTLLRYFRTAGNPTPCAEPMSGEPVIGSGAYRLEPWNPLPESHVSLVPVDGRHYPVEISYVADDNTRVLDLLRGSYDATLNTVSVAKTRWLQKNHADRFALVERRGTRVSYLAFNLRHPILSDVRVRRALALAIHRDLIVEKKFFGLATLAGSILAPDLPESEQRNFDFNPELAGQILDDAGYRRKSDGTRFELLYKTTPVREGFETALMLREMLRHIGVKIRLEVLEPAVYLQNIRKGNFQIISSYWIGVADGSILYRTLHSKSPDNRAGYRNAHVDELLEKAITELDPEKRARRMKEVQRISADELPYFPLWYWHEGLLVRRDRPELLKIRSQDLSLSGALEPILILR